MTWFLHIKQKQEIYSCKIGGNEGAKIPILGLLPVKRQLTPRAFPSRYSAHHSLFCTSHVSSCTSMSLSLWASQHQTQYRHLERQKQPHKSIATTQIYIHQSIRLADGNRGWNFPFKMLQRAKFWSCPFKGLFGQFTMLHVPSPCTNLEFWTSLLWREYGNRWRYRVL